MLAPLKDPESRHNWYLAANASFNKYPEALDFLANMFPLNHGPTSLPFPCHRRSMPTTSPRRRVQILQWPRHDSSHGLGKVPPPLLLNLLPYDFPSIQPLTSLPAVG